MNRHPSSKTKTFNNHIQHQTIIHQSLVGLQQTSAFLKKEIGEIIKGELKAYHLRTQLQSELQDYNKQQQNQKMAKQALNDRINAFRDKEKRYRNKELELFESRQKEREYKLKMFVFDKQNAHHTKCQQTNQALNKVRERYFNITYQDINKRISKLAHTSQGKRTHKSNFQPQSKNISLSQNSSRVKVVKQFQAEDQQHKITNYMNKIERSQSKILLKEIQKEKRRQTSLKKKVLCLVGQRKKLQQERMQRAEREYTKRMDTFASNYSRITQSKELALMNRTMANARILKQVNTRRQQLHKQEIDKIVNNYNSGSTNNLLQQYRSALDLNYTKNNRSLNLRKKKLQQNSVQLTNRIKLLAQKMTTVKNIRYGQKLDNATINTILSLIDKNDPEYSSIAEFLRSERGAFIEGIVRREQQQRTKLKKMIKGVNKGSTL